MRAALRYSKPLTIFSREDVLRRCRIPSAGDYPPRRSHTRRPAFIRRSLSMLGIGPMELMIVLLIGLLLFGNRLPATMRSLGKSVNEFKKGVQDGENDLCQDVAASTPHPLPDRLDQAP